MLDQAWDTIAARYADLAQALAQVKAFLAAYPPLGTLWYALKVFAVLFVVIFILEMLAGARLRRYWTRNFRTDLTYGFFYLGGIYNALIYVPLAAGIALLLPSWNFRLLDYVPGPLGFVIYWLAADAAGYWIHRWYHSNPIFWEFHKIHHTQTEMTFVTSFRNHFMEQVVSNLALFVPLMLLGVPLWFWPPVLILQLVFEGLQHSDLKWRYGWFYPILVSPIFHAIHHSPERVRHDSNYGKILSVWDYLFGTMSVGERPPRYGLNGVSVPESFTGTTLAPFIALWRRMPAFARGRINPPA